MVEIKGKPFDIEYSNRMLEVLKLFHKLNLEYLPTDEESLTTVSLKVKILSIEKELMEIAEIILQKSVKESGICMK
jgi:hypothetical protein